LPLCAEERKDFKTRVRKKRKTKKYRNYAPAFRRTALKGGTADRGENDSVKRKMGMKGKERRLLIVTEPTRCARLERMYLRREKAGTGRPR